MSTTIDEKVVEMRFDNRQFEQGVQTSLDTISNLRKSLNLTGASKGLEGISDAAKKVDLSSVGSAAETIGLKFSAMYTMADQALRNITNSAMNYGKRIASALTIEPVRTGLSEYETQIGAVQTILANTESKGSTLEDVNGALDKLNKYADKTIYNFTEMTRNIGTFTAAGVDLDTSVKSIQGIANLAAVSGSTSQQASTAMYQLSQALAAGKVSLMDWNSVVNAGMGGQVFQDALKRTATAMGTDVDALIEKYGSFRESLTQGEWLTADVLTKTLEQFTMSAKEGSKEWEAYKESLMAEGYTDQQAEEILKMANTAENAATKVKTFSQLWDTLKETAQSGWTQTWEIIVGDFEEAKETLSKASEVLGDLVNGMSDARNALLQGWKDLGGRTALIDAIKNAFTGVMNVVKPIGQAFREIFPALKPEQLLAATEKIRDKMAAFAEAFKEGSKNAENLKRTFKGVFAVVDIVKQVFVAAFKAVGSLFGGVGELGSGLLGVTATIGDFLVKVRDVITSSDIFNKILQGIASVVKVVIKVISLLVKGLGEFVIGPGFNLLAKVLSKVVEGMVNLGETAKKAKDAVAGALEDMGAKASGNPFLSFIESVWKGIKSIGSGVVKAFKFLMNGAATAFGKIDLSGIIEFINALTAGGIAAAILKFSKGFQGMFDGVGDAIGSLSDLTSGVVDILDGVKGSLEAYQSQLKAGTLMKIAGAIAILTASIVVLSFIDAEKLGVAIAAITALFTELMISMAIFSKVSGEIGGVAKSVTAMLGISTAVLILSIALKNVATLDSEQLATGIAGIASLTAVMVIAAKVLSKNKKAIKKGATQMVIFAAAIKILASVCEDIASLSWEGMAKGLIGVSVLLASVSTFMNKSKFSGKSVTTATGIVILASALKIMASACKDFGQMSGDELIKGLGSITAIMVALTAFTKITSGSKGMLSVGIGMLAISAAVKSFASSVKELGSMSWEQLGIGLAAIAGALLAVTLAVNFMPKNIATVGIGLVIVASAIKTLAGALSTMGGMSGNGAIQSLGVLAGTLAILAVGLRVMTGAMSGAAALIVVAGALAVLAPVLLMFGSMSLQTIGTGLLAIAGTFAVVGLAGYLLAPVVPVILAFSKALLVVGLATLGIGAGLTLIGAGITALAAAIMAGVGTIVGGLSMLITGFIAIIVGIVDQIAALIVAICQAVIKAAPAIIEAITVIITGILDAAIKIIPPLLECIRLILDAVLSLLVEYIPKIVEVAIQLIVALLESVYAHIGEIVELALLIIAEFINGIAAGIPKVIDAGIKLIIEFINGLANGIRENTDAMIAAVDNLMNAVLDAIIKWFTNLIGLGGDIVSKVVSGIMSAIGEVASGAKKIVTSLIDGIKEGVTGIISAGKDMVTGFIDGIKSGIKAVGNAAKEIGGKALGAIKKVLGIKSPSKEFAEIGEFSGEGLIGGLRSCTGKVADTAGEMGSSALDAVRGAVSGLGDAINGDFETQPVIKPVLDLSEVQSGASAISNLLGQEQTVGVNADAISATMAHKNQNGSTDDVVSAIDKLRADLAGVGGTSYTINGITYDDGSNVSEAIKALVRAAKVERRVN